MPPRRRFELAVAADRQPRLIEATALRDVPGAHEARRASAGLE